MLAVSCAHLTGLPIALKPMDMITAMRYAVVCNHAQYSQSGQLTFIGVAGDAIVVDVVPTPGRSG